jgi:Macrocin-O-methyltransferase (TylF)
MIGPARGRKTPLAPEQLDALVSAAGREFPRVRAAFAEAGFALFKRKPGHRYAPKLSRKRVNKLRTPLEDDKFMAMARDIVEPRLTVLGYDRLYTLYQALRSTIAAVPGSEPIELLEVGVYKGGSSWFLAFAGSTLAPGRVRLTAVDTFEGHSTLDLPGGSEGPHRPASFADTGYEQVREYLSSFDFVEVVKGRIQDVAGRLEARRIHLAHVDVDIYAPTRFTLDFLAQRMAPGGAIVVDDYDFKTCAGVKQAVDEFAAERGAAFFKLAPGNGQCCLVLTRPPKGN